MCESHSFLHTESDPQSALRLALLQLEPKAGGPLSAVDLCVGSDRAGVRCPVYPYFHGTFYEVGMSYKNPEWDPFSKPDPVQCVMSVVDPVMGAGRSMRPSGPVVPKRVGTKTDPYGSVRGGLGLPPIGQAWCVSP